MSTWDEFAAAAPELAALGLRTIERSGDGHVLLVTVRGDALPRINPISVAVVEGRLVGFLIVGSAKVADLVEDGRYAMHAYIDRSHPDECQVRGHAQEITDPTFRAAAVANWAFEVDDGYRLFEYSVEHVVIGERPDEDAWPPTYSSWRAAT